jgi:tetratricopeptide (TPR) repeat protein
MKVGPYELISELSRGDRSVTHRARAPGGGEVTLTLVRSDPQSFEGFQKERPVLDGLTLADGFVPVVDAGTSEAGVYLVQSLLAGGTLRDSMRAHPMPQGDVVRLVRGLASALARAHDRGLVHGELSPGSVVLSEGQPFITDLALARCFSADPAARNPTYAAPEARTGPPTERSDVYSLGVVLKEMLGADPPRREVGRAIERACAADPAERFEDARVFLRAIGGGVGPAVHAPTRADTETRSGASLEIPGASTSRRWIPYAIFSFLLVAAVTVVGLHALDVHKTEELELGFLDAASKKDRRPAELLRTAESFPPRVRARPAVQSTIAALTSEVQAAESRAKLGALVASFGEDSKAAARLDAAEKALALDPRCAPALLARARARLELGRKDAATLAESRKAARADLEKAVECDHSLVAAHFELASLLALWPNERKHAEDEFEATRSLEPDSTLGLVAAGEGALIAGNIRQIEQAFEGAVAKRPETVLAYLARARAKLELDVDWPGALDDTGHALALAPASAEAHLLRGWALSRMPKPPQPPLEELDKAIALDPLLAEAWARRAMVRFRAGDAQGAQNDLNEGGRLDTDVAIGWLAGAELNAFIPGHGTDLNHERERLERAQKFLDQAITRKPHLFQAAFDEVLVFATLGDARNALAWCDRGLRMQPRHPDLLFHRAVQLFLSNQPDEARAAFDRAVEITPNQPAVHFWRGKFRVEAAPQNFPGAVEDMTRVLELEANVPDARFLRGVAFQNLGRYQDAIADYDATERMAPNAPYMPTVRKLRDEARAALAR